MEKFLLVGCGGFLGSVARYGVALWLPRGGPDSFPVATFGVNLLGCFFLGVLMGVAAVRPALGENVRVFLMTGILGGFTTFSAFGLESFDLVRQGRIDIAVLYCGASMLGGILSVGLGWVAGKNF